MSWHSSGYFPSVRTFLLASGPPPVRTPAYPRETPYLCQPGAFQPGHAQLYGGNVLNKPMPPLIKQDRAHHHPAAAAPVVEAGPMPELEYMPGRRMFEYMKENYSRVEEVKKSPGTPVEPSTEVSDDPRLPGTPPRSAYEPNSKNLADELEADEASSTKSSGGTSDKQNMNNDADEGDSSESLNLNFGVDDESGEKRRPVRDPMSHRIIEKRRRDRMNNCLADLSRLIPSSYLKKGRGRIEKTEIIEMAIKYMKHMQLHTNCKSIEKCELSSGDDKMGMDSLASGYSSVASTPSPAPGAVSASEMERNVESFRMGYHECLSEIMHLLIEKEGMHARDPFCVKLVTHMQKYYDKLSRVKGLHDTNTPCSDASLNPTAVHSSMPSFAPSSTTMGAGISTMSESDCESQKYSAVPQSITSTGIHSAAPSEEYVVPKRSSREHTEAETEEKAKGDEHTSGFKYKFKANICHRFSHEEDAVNSENSSVKRARLESNEAGPNLKHEAETSNLKLLSLTASAVDDARRNSIPTMDSGGLNSVAQGPPPLIRDDALVGESKPKMGQQHDQRRYPHHQSGNSVPIFALHPNRSYYLPLSVDYALLAPFMSRAESAGSFRSESGANHSVVLHPITINVNFDGPVVPVSSPFLGHPLRDAAPLRAATVTTES